MPRIPTITNRESPVVGAPQSHATGEDFGAGIGRAMQGLGNTIAQVGAQFSGIGEQQRAEKDLMDVTTAYANSSYVEPFNETVTNYPDPSGKGLTGLVDSNYDTWMNDKVAAFAATGASSKAQDAYKIQLLQDKRMYTGKAAEEAAVLGASHAQVQSETGLSTIINDVRSGGLIAETDFNIQLSKGIQLLVTRPGFNAVDKEAGIRKLTSDLSQARFSAMADAQTTVLGIDAVIEELQDPRWEARFGQAEYDQQKRYVESAKQSIQTQARAIVDSSIEGLSARAGMVAIPYDELSATISTINEQGPLTVPQAAKLNRIISQNEELVRLQGHTAGDVHALDTPSATVTGAGGTARISYSNQRAIRNKPITPQLAGLYASAAAVAGIDEVRVVSGGQDAKGEGSRRTGSTRHDYGNAGDIQLLVNGRPLHMDNPADMPKIMAFVKAAWAGGATGIGAGPAYMGQSTFHVGYGAKRIWSSTRQGQSVMPWLVEATSGSQVAGAGNGGAVNSRLQSVGNQYGVSAGILDGMWFAESNRGQNKNVSSAGAKGPFQFMDATWRQYGNGGDVNNFEDASDAAGRMMRDMLKQFHGDIDLALMAYNWGEGNVRDWIKEGKDPNAIPQETRDYVQKVKANGGGGTGDTTGGYAGGMSGEQYDRSVVRDRFIKDQQVGLNSGVMDYLQTPNGGSHTIEPMTLSTSPDMLEVREQIYENAKAKFELQPDQMKPLTNAEVSNLSQIMATGDPMQQLGVLSMFSNWSKPNQEAAYDQIGAKDKVAGYAGGMSANGQQDLAFEALQGRISLTAMKEQGEVKWKTDADTYFRENWASNPSLRGLDPSTVDAMKGAADAIMAHRMRNTGEEYDEDEYAKVWAEVLGREVESVNGTDMVMPLNVTADDLETALEVMGTDDWTQRSTSQTPPIGADLQPLEGWQLEGAEFVVVNSENDYRVVIDGQPVMTLNPMSGQPEAFVMKVESDWVEDVLLRAESGYLPPGSAASPEGSTTAAVTTGTTTGTPPVPAQAIVPTAGSPLLPGIDTLAPLMDPAVAAPVAASRQPYVAPDRSSTGENFYRQPEYRQQGEPGDIQGGSGGSAGAGSSGNDLLNSEGTYTVKKNDNLTKIAKQFGVSIDAIAQTNGIKNINKIAKGQKLVIPGARPAVQANIPSPRLRPGTRDVPGIPNPPRRPVRGIDELRQKLVDAGVRPASSIAGAKINYLQHVQQRRARATIEQLTLSLNQRTLNSYRGRLIASGKFSSDVIDRLVKDFEGSLK